MLGAQPSVSHSFFKLGLIRNCQALGEATRQVRFQWHSLKPVGDRPGTSGNRVTTPSIDLPGKEMVWFSVDFPLSQPNEAEHLVLFSAHHLSMEPHKGSNRFHIAGGISRHQRSISCLKRWRSGKLQACSHHLENSDSRVFLWFRLMVLDSIETSRLARAGLLAG